MARKKELIPWFVSVLIPTFERPKLLEKTLESALNQTYTNYEVIVADSSRDEDTQVLMHKFRGSDKLIYVRNREAKSKAENFRVFEELARGEFLQWLMDDDIILPNKLQYMIRCFKQEKKVRIVTSRRGLIDEKGTMLGQMGAELVIDGLYGVYKGREIGNVILEDFKNPIGEVSAVLFRWRDLRNHYFNAESRGYRAIADVAMWLELLEGGGECAVFRDPLSLYRRHNGQESMQPDYILLSRIEWFMLGTDYYLRRIFLTQWKEYANLLYALLAEYERDIQPRIRIFNRQPHFEAYMVAINEMKDILKSHGG
ncbi:MAG: glycosyltransferase family 2 protein [Selenomonadaceae bacterium]|nr:glycosyltransferase family 2 protein [Selenomonadaceae bacterium]